MCPWRECGSVYLSPLGRIVGVIDDARSLSSSHKAIRDLRISRQYENAQKVTERVARVLEQIQKGDEDEDANPMLRAPEDVLKAAACMLVVCALALALL